MNSTRSHAICADNWWNRLHDSTSFHVEGTNDVDSNISPLKSDNTTRCTTPMHCKLHVFNRPLFIESDQNINVSMGSITKSYKYYHKNVGFLPSEYLPGRKSTNVTKPTGQSIGNTPSITNSSKTTVIFAKKEVLSLRCNEIIQLNARDRTKDRNGRISINFPNKTLNRREPMNHPDSVIVWKNETKSERENKASGDDIFNDSIVWGELALNTMSCLDNPNIKNVHVNRKYI